MLTEREESQNFPGPAEWPDRLSHHLTRQWHYLGALGTSVTLDYVLALKHSGSSQSYTKLFGVLYENKYYRALCQQEPHRYSYSLRPNYIYLGRLLCISELQELSVLEGVGCALAGKGPGSGADEIISSTPSAHGSPQINNK